MLEGESVVVATSRSPAGCRALSSSGRSLRVSPRGSMRVERDSQVAASVMEPVMIGSAKSFSDARVRSKRSGRLGRVPWIFVAG
jgi:hypothetical protein